MPWFSLSVLTSSFWDVEKHHCILDKRSQSWRDDEKLLNLLVLLWILILKKNTRVFDVDGSSEFTRLIPKMQLHQRHITVIKLSFYFLHFLFLPRLSIEHPREDISNQCQIHPPKIINSSARLDANPHPVWVKHLVWWANC